MLPVSDDVPIRRFPIVNVALIVANFAVWIFYELPRLDVPVSDASFYPARLVLPRRLVPVPADRGELRHVQRERKRWRSCVLRTRRRIRVRLHRRPGAISRRTDRRGRGAGRTRRRARLVWLVPVRADHPQRHARATGRQLLSLRIRDRLSRTAGRRDGRAPIPPPPLLWGYAPDTAYTSVELFLVGVRSVGLSTDRIARQEGWVVALPSEQLVLT